MINRNFFFMQIKLNPFRGLLNQSQVNGLTAILNEWEQKYASKDDRWLAYMLATVHHETDKTMKPIREYGKGAGRPYSKADPVTGQVYYGRGFVQLTWKDNYQKMGTVVGADLVDNPDLALDPAIASEIMFYGMINGSFTGKHLGDYFSKDKEDWVNARRIINGLDKANQIADYGKSYYAAISHTT